MARYILKIRRPDQTGYTEEYTTLGEAMREAQRINLCRGWWATLWVKSYGEWVKLF